MTQKTDTRSLLSDIGPGLWISVSPGYVCPTRRTMTSSQAHAHVFDAAKGWADPCDKTHHLKQEEMMKHADKCLQLNEEYQDQYRLTKEKLMTTPKGKPLTARGLCR